MSVTTNHLVGVDAGGQIWYERAQEWYQSTGTKTAAEAYGISVCDDAKLMDPWEKIPGQLTQVAARGGRVLGLSPAGSILEYNPTHINTISGNNWFNVDGTASYIAVSVNWVFIIRNGQLLVRDMDKNAWVPASPSPPGTSLSSVAVGGSYVYVSTASAYNVFSTTIEAAPSVSSSGTSAHAAKAVLTFLFALPGYPSNDQQIRITGELLKDPLVAEVVPAKLLNIRLSHQIEFGTVDYLDDPQANCYWQKAQCTRTKDTEYFKADVVVCPNPNTWGITYDDGPTKSSGPDTAKIQAELAAIGANATFFVTGTASRQNINTLRATYAAGYHIASHTYTHHPLTSATNEEIVAELKYTESVIYETLGIVPRFFRPPYGDIDDRVRAIAYALGYTPIIWEGRYDSQDWKDTVPEDSAIEALVGYAKSGKPGFISLEHDISERTSGIAIRALQKIRAQGLHKTMHITSVADCVSEPAYADPSLFIKRPTGPCPTYVIRDGDFCSAIASAHGLDLETFKSMNPNVNCNNLGSGQVVCVGPGTRPLDPATSPALGKIAGYSKELILVVAAVVGMQFLF
ncbi:chitin deacetylase [Geranomyces michiganensis]|nr:chitin deacetylase [Geranomyces michiganensis]